MVSTHSHSKINNTWSFYFFCTHNNSNPRRQKTLFVTSQTRGEYHIIHPHEYSSDLMVCNPLINATLFSHRNTLSLTWRLPRLSSWMQRYRTPLSPLAFSTMHHVTSCILFQRQHIYLQETRVQNWWRLYHNRLQFCQPAVFHMLYHNRKQD